MPTTKKAWEEARKTCTCPQCISKEKPPLNKNKQIAVLQKKVKTNSALTFPIW